MDENGVEHLCFANNMFLKCYTCFLRDSNDLRNIPVDLCLTG